MDSGRHILGNMSVWSRQNHIMDRNCVINGFLALICYEMGGGGVHFGDDRHLHHVPENHDHTVDEPTLGLDRRQ